MDFKTYAQKHLCDSDLCCVCLLGFLVIDGERHGCLLVIVQHNTQECGLFVYNLNQKGVQSAADLHISNIFAINEFFKFSIVNQGNFGSEEHFTVQINSEEHNITVLISNGIEASAFLAQLKQAISAYHKNSTVGPHSHDWLTQYRDNMAKNSQFYTDDLDLFKGSNADGWPHSMINVSNVGENCTVVKDDNMRKSASFQSFTSSDSWSTNSFNRTSNDLDSMKRSMDNLADSARQRETLSDREHQIRLAMKDREDEYTRLKPLRVFCGTWNVNGQVASENCSPWLASDEEAPDIYAIGFQELDLSKNAYVFTESAKEGEWLTRIQEALPLNESYIKIKTVRLVGMMLVVLIKENLNSAVQQIVSHTVATGIMSVLGNKGGVGIGFQLFDTSICFINSHFAAHLEEVERRNQDYQAINRSMKLGSRCINDHDFVFWLGDFNYRLDEIESFQCKVLIDEKNFDALLGYDQLKKQQDLRKVFNNFDEPAIKFQPTYKYDPGTNTWDSSDKLRKPAWCDRVLFMGKGIEARNYRCHQKHLLSDHKPVSAYFNVPFKEEISEKRHQVYEDVMKTLDRWENYWLPQVTLDITDVYFSDVKFRESQSKTIKIKNVGKSLVEFEFIAKLNEKYPCKKWMTIRPSRHTIAVDEEYEVQLEVLVDRHTIANLNSGKDDMNDILVLHLHGGKDLFISVSGNIIHTSFGMSLEKLCKMYGPIAEVPTGNLLDLGIAAEASKSNESSDGALDVPKEIWRLVDHIYKNGMDQPNLFRTSGMHSEVQAIRDCLDAGVPATIPGNFHSVAEALIEFMACLENPVIHPSQREDCIMGHSNFLLGKMVIKKMPMCHQKLFTYMCAFLRQLLKHPQNMLDIQQLTAVFTPIFFGPAQHSTRSRRDDKRMQIAFLTQFLLNEFDCLE